MKGKKSPPDMGQLVNAPDFILLFDIHNNVIARTKLFFDDSTDDDDILQLILIVPKEKLFDLIQIRS